jgi:hypothetical protein
MSRVATFVDAYNRALIEHGMEAITRTTMIALASRKTSTGSRQKVMGPAWSVPHIATYLEWCDRRDVDPERFMLARLMSLNWKKRIPIAHLASESFLPKFRTFGDGLAAKGLLQARMTEAVQPDNDGIAFPRQFWERLKQRTPDREVCVLSADVNGGWHPRSKWCRPCSNAVTCRATLDPHVVEARERVGR